MAENTKIEWAHHTFNPWVGCTKISPACDHCYAEGWARRTGQAELWNGARRRTSEANWRQPLKWNKAAAEAGERHRVFCASLADVFDNQADPHWRDHLWGLIAATPHLDWLLLTKRPQNIAKMLPPDWGDGWPNVWLGTTVENQEEANRRIPALLAVPAAIRFLSCEPLLGLLDLYPWLLGFAGGNPAQCACGHGHGFTRCPYTGHVAHKCHRAACSCAGFNKKRHGSGLHWIITGGESGGGARPMHPDWARSLRDQCAAAGAAFHFKQWGEWTPMPLVADHPIWGEPLAADRIKLEAGVPIYRVGKKIAGRLLDGQIHDGLPA